jgi:hypothetical protein
VVEIDDAQLNDPDEVTDLVQEICGVDGLDDDDNIIDNGTQPLLNTFIERHDYIKAGKKDVEEGKKPVEFVNTRYLRAVPPSEVMEKLSEKEIERLFPDGLLETLVQEEQQDDD